MRYCGSTDVAKETRLRGFAAVPASEFVLTAATQRQLQQLKRAWNDLPADRHMADGGRYRFRRYSRFRLDRAGRSLEPLEGNSIFQSRADNPLNGGVTRTFEPLHPSTAESQFLRDLIWLDFALLPTEGVQDWIVGVHQVRILATPQEHGKPTPEGVHIDAEKFTVQHLIERKSVEGGVFYAYDREKRPVFSWCQTETLDSVYFTGQTWHSATPIETRARAGIRDILLVDFDPLLVG